MTTADVECGRIVLRVSLSDMLAAQKIPGVKWDRDRKAFTLPASAEHAEIVRASLRGLLETDAFKQLRASVAVSAEPATAGVIGSDEAAVTEADPDEPVVEPVETSAPVPADAERAEDEVEIVVPQGLLTQPWRHQRAAYKFCLDHFAQGLYGILLAIGMGGGKTMVTIMLVLGLSANRVLIACPLRVVPVWLTQFGRHAGIDIEIVALDEDAGSVAKKRELAEEKLRLAQVRNVPYIAVVNYDSAWRDPFAAWAEKQSWDIVIADECVPANTLIATPNGPVPIQSLKEGSTVLGVDADGRITRSEVTATFKRFSSQPLVQVGSLQATQNHPVWVQGRGYIEAATVCPGDRIRVYENSHDCLRVVRNVFREEVVGREVEAAFLHQGVLGAMENVAARVRGSAARQMRPESEGGGDEAELGAPGVRFPASRLSEVGTESVSGRESQGQRTSGAARPGLSYAERREWHGADSPAEDAGRAVGVAHRVHRADENASRRRIPIALQTGHREPGADGSRGGGWAEPSCDGPHLTGSEEGRATGTLGVAGGAGEERGSSAGLRECGAGRLVFNLETSTGNYFANGVLVHNCHRLKAPGGKASLFFKRMRLRARYRIGLTGTPMPHGPLDVYAQCRFLDVNIFGPSFTAFRAKYAVMGGYQRKQITGYQNLEDFEARLSRITYRVGKEVLDLPPETDVTYHCELGPEARRIYSDLEQDLVAGVGEGRVTAANAMVMITRLHQVTNGVAKTDDGEEIRVDDTKRRLLSDILEDIGKDEAVVVFCRFHLDLDAVHEACEANGFTSLELSGRRDELRRWQDGEAQVLAVQIAAGGIGVDLTRARYSIYYSIGFSLADYMQARSRVHRPGQTRPVEHIHVIAKNTVDVRIMRALEKRADVVESILAEIKN